MIAQVRSYAEIERNVAQGKMSALLTIEEGGVCHGDIELLHRFYSDGVRMLTLIWNFENELGFPHSDSQNRGLKKRGFEFLEEMESLGIIADVSHLSDRGFYDVCKAATKPFTASHSCCRSICDHSRNLTDDMIKALADRGGVIGVNYYSLFLRSGENVSHVSDIARHIRHMVKKGGIGCVGLGSDYDGMKCELEMWDCSTLPVLAQELKKQGFSDDETEAVFSSNVLRFYRELL